MRIEVRFEIDDTVFAGSLDRLVDIIGDLNANSGAVKEEGDSSEPELSRLLDELRSSRRRVIE